jgi:hypothetical protein
MSLAKIVRPYQTNDVTPGKVVPQATPASAPDNVVLEFGANGSGKIVHGHSSFSRTTYQDKRPREAVGGGRLIDVSFPAIRFNNGQLQQ